jgi:hypothetical protein
MKDAWRRRGRSNRKTNGRGYHFSKKVIETIACKLSEVIFFTVSIFFRSYMVFFSEGKIREQLTTFDYALVAAKMTHSPPSASTNFEYVSLVCV